MLKEPTIEKLKAMRLDAMASAWNEQHGKPDVNRLSFDERFGMLVDAEWLYRENRRLAKALRDYKSGVRKNPIMGAMAQPLTPADIENMAAYYASQAGPLKSLY